MDKQSKPVDVEALQERCRRRGCLDGFFTLSIIFLFVALTAVTVCGVTVAMELKNSIPTAERQPSRAAPQTYKTENIAYLRTASNQLQYNSTMQFVSIYQGEGTSVGSNFKFDPDRHSLTPKQEGYYFIYIDLTVSCTFNCSAGLLRVEVGQTLTCDVQLPSKVQSVTRKCWTVTWLPQENLLTQLTVPKGGLPNWILDVRESGVGMFLVD